MGPNVKKLVTHKASLDAVPAGSGLGGALSVLTTPGRLQQVLRDAAEWVNQAIAVVKTAPDNPYGNDDEAIAGEILRQLEERKRK